MGWPRVSELTLAPDLAVVHQARGFIRQQCQVRRFNPETRETAALLASEIVTNAIIHGRSEARIRVSGGAAGWLRVEVADDNSRHPQPVEQDTDALDGRGLAIVELLAGRWGVQDDPYGKTVWFEIDNVSS